MKKEELDRLFDFLVENNTWCAIWSWTGNVDADKEGCYELIHPLHYKDDSLIEKPWFIIHHVDMIWKDNELTVLFFDHDFEQYDEWIFEPDQ